MKYGLRALGISLFFFLHLAAFAEGPVRPIIRRFEVNGLTVYLINTHVGNGVNLSVDVKVGSWHDRGPHAGRAHLWEHWIHAGSKKFPGQSTFDTKTTEMGAETNAYTAKSRTYYHGYMHPDALPDWAALLGGMLSEPEWDEAVFQLEKGAVIDEAGNYQKQDDTALKGSIFLELLPAGHPLAMYDVGTEAQLNAMTVRDMQELFYSGYNRHTMSMILSGNFDALPDGTVPLTEAQALSVIRENFKLPVPGPALNLPATRPPQSIRFPSIVSENTGDQSRLIEIGATAGTRSLQLTFEMERTLGKYHHGVLEVLTDYLNLEAPGSLKDLLEKKGWITSAGVYTSSVNNLYLIHADFELTEEGARHRYEVPDLLFATLHDIKTNGLRPEVLEYLKTRNIKSYEQSVLEASGAAEQLARSLDHVADPLAAFDFEAQYGGVTSVDVMRAVPQAFPLAKMIGGYVGPEINALPTPERAQVFDRPLVRVQDPNIVGRWRTLFDQGALAGPAVNVQLSKVALSFSDAPIAAPSQPARVLDLNMKGVRAALDEQHLLNSGGFQISLTLPPVPLSQSAAMELFLECFKDRYKSEIDYLSSMGVPTNVNYGNGVLYFYTRGNSKATLSAQDWLQERFLSFTPSREEVELAKEVLDAEFQESQQDFAARIARTTANSLLSRYRFLDRNIVARAKLLDHTTVKQLVDSTLSRADLVAAFAGDYTEEHVRETLEKVRSRVPLPLRSAQRKRMAHTALALLNTTHFWHVLPGEEGSDKFGIARIFQGPAFGEERLREHAAFTVLQLSLNREIYQLNRAQRRLGYVHGASTYSSLTGNHMTFVGQTEGVSRFPLIEQGWSEILARLQNGSLSSDGYRGEKQGAYRAARLLPENFGDAAARLFGAFFYTGNPRWSDQGAAVMPTLTGAEIDEVGRRYLLNVNHVSVIASNNKPDCEGLITSETVARRNIERASK